MKDTNIIIKKVQVNYLLSLEISSEELLNYMRDHDTISLGEAQSNIVMSKRTFYLSKHTYSITQGKDGGWFTHFVLPTGKRIMVRAADRFEIENKIIDFYKGQIETPCFRAIFQRWIDEKCEFKEIAQSSYTRYMNDFNRFFPPESSFCNIPLINMTDSIMERFVKQSIRDHHLTRKTFSGLRILLMGTFKYAKREGYTDYSISTFFGDLNLPDRIFQKKTHKSDEEEVFNTSESTRLIEHLKEKGDIISLGLILMFQTGVRVGELAALTPQSITPDGIRITATEVYYKDPETGMKTYAVQDTPKTECGERIIYLPPQAQETIDAILRLNPSGKYLFMDKGERIVSKRMNYYLKKACRELGIRERTTHKIRKTYASTLINEHVNEKLVMKQLGHKCIGTTKQYYFFNTNDKSADKQIIANAVNF